MADDQWLIMQRAQGLDVWNLGPVTADQTEELAIRARIVVGASPGDDTPGLVSVAPGEPHPQTMLRAVKHERAELDGITREQVDNYRTSVARAAQSKRIDSMASQVAALSTADQEALRGRLGWPPKGNGNGVIKG